MFGLEQIVDSLKGFANLGEKLFGQHETTRSLDTTGRPDMTLIPTEPKVPGTLLGEADNLPEVFIPPWDHHFSNS